MKTKTRNILAGVAAAGALAGVSLLVIQRQRQRRDWLRFGSDGEPGQDYGGWHSQGSPLESGQMQNQQPGREQPGSPLQDRPLPDRAQPLGVSPQERNWSGSAPEDKTQPVRSQRPGQSQAGSEQPGSEQPGSELPRRVEGPVMGTRYQPADQPDRITPIPETGGAPAPTPERAPDLMEQPVEVTELAGPMFQYLLAFQAMMDQLRARRRDSDGSSGARSLLPEDRARSQEVLDRLENQLADYSLGRLEDGSLQERMYRLAVKVRDALQNLEYTDADLFRIYGEVRSEACHLIDQIHTEDLDLERVRNAYECAED